MSYIHFKKEELIDLGFSTKREILLVNKSGAWCSTSLANCNTRKYHGLLVVPQLQINDNRYVLLSTMDETLTRGEDKKHLGTHRYPNIYYPEGYKYLNEFDYELTPTWTITAEDVEITKEIVMIQDEDRVLIRYTINKADTPFEMRFDPFLAFRNVHSLSHSNLYANKKWEKAGNGISCKLYNEFTNLFLQFSRKVDFVSTPDWYYNVEYSREQERGYDYKEDLFSPGYFKIKVKKGDQLIFSAGTSEISPRKLTHLFERELKNRNPLNNFNDCIQNAAEQFVVTSSPQKGPGDEIEIMAGYHWFGPWGRDTFISLPGLTLSTGKLELCKKILDANLENLKDGLFPNVGTGEQAAYNSADASLWFIWAVQQYIYQTNNIELAWEEYGEALKNILENYRKGTLYNIHMEDNGLLYAGEDGVAVTWMDAVVEGKPVTPRTGFAVELNALWFNAIHFALECAKKAISHQPSAKTFTYEWNSLAEQIELSFTETFWNDEKGYLADCVNGSHHDWSIRPNQVFAASLPFSPISDEMKKSVLTIVKDKLLTPRGLRTLSPDDINYKGIYQGNTYTRDMAYHQGTVWPWLLGHFAEACLKAGIEDAYQLVDTIYQQFEPTVMEYGIGTIAEIYDGDAPHNPNGAISQAWSIAELLRIRELLNRYKVSSEEIPLGKVQKVKNLNKTLQPL
jgi:predicted glycogen debranching enzyme